MSYQRTFTPSRVLAYARVSGQEQARTGTSLDGQREEIEAWCKARGYPRPTLYIEVESGSGEAVERRGEQLRLTADARAGDMVVVTRQDRWSRDVAHFLTSTTALMKRGIRFEAVHEGFDHATPEGRFIATMHAAFSEHERAKIYGRTVVRRKQLRDQGLYVEGLPPFGYKRHERRLVVVPERAAIVGRAFDLCALGHSLDDIVYDLGEEHGDRSMWRDRLRSRHYLGEVRDSGGSWVKSHPPIVSAELWCTVQSALDRRRKAGRAPGQDARTANWLLRRIATCLECGAPVSASYSHKADDGYYVCRERMYRKACSCIPSLVSATDPEAAQQVHARLLELRGILSKSPPTAKKASRVPAISARVDKLNAKRERLIDLATDGAISRAELAGRLASLDRERIEEETRLVAAEAADKANSADVRAELLADVDVMHRAWSGATVAERRTIVELLAERVRVGDGLVRIDWRDGTDLAVYDVSAGTCSSPPWRASWSPPARPTP